MEAPTPLLTEDGNPDSRFVMFRAIAVRRTDSPHDMTQANTVAEAIFQKTRIAVVAIDTVVCPNTRLESVTGTTVVHKLIVGAADTATLSRMLGPELWTSSAHITEWVDPDHDMTIQEYDLYVVDGELSAAPPAQERTVKVISLDDNLADSENLFMKNATDSAQASASRQTGSEKKLQDLLIVKAQITAMDLDDRMAKAEEALGERKRQREEAQLRAAIKKEEHVPANEPVRKQPPPAPNPKLLVTHENTGIQHIIDPRSVPN